MNWSGIDNVHNLTLHRFSKEITLNVFALSFL